MRGGQNARLRRRLEALQRAAEAGDRGAAGEARLLADWLNDEAASSAKRAEDRIKVLVGAAILEQVRRGQFQLVDLLGVMDSFLVRPTERQAVLGRNGQGSETLIKLASIRS